MYQTTSTRGKVRETTAVQQMIASGSGAIITSILVTPLDVVKIRLQKQVKQRYFQYRSVTPLDVVKVRMQAQKHGPLTPGRCFIYGNGLMDHLCTCVHPYDKTTLESCHVPWYNRPGKFNGTLDALVKIARKEGVTSLWSGLPPTLVMAVPATVCYFTLYDQLNTILLNRFGKATTKEAILIPMTAGAAARIAAATLISPLELIRTKMQAERISYLDVIKAIRITTATEGWRSLWRGWAPTLWRDVPFSAIYWSAYEASKAFCLQRLNRQETTFSISFICGFIGGALAAFVTCPFDVVKTHRQIELGEQMAAGGKGQKSSTFLLLKRLYQQQRLRGLFAGLVPRLIKVAPACAIMIGSYEYGKTFFIHQNRIRA